MSFMPPFERCRLKHHNENDIEKFRPNLGIYRIILYAAPHKRQACSNPVIASAESSGSITYQRQDSAGQKDDLTHRKNQSDEKEGQWPDRLSDEVEASASMTQ
jgi:hypothetical protein